MSDWEAICKKCGACCFEKWIRADGTVVTTRLACRFLDVVSRECKVYRQRLQVGEGCVNLTPEVVRTADWLPPDCAYRQHLQRPSPRESDT